MKRNFLTALSLSVVMVGGMVANAAAADITFGGQLRPRFEVFEQNDFNDTTNPTYIISTRIRLNVNAKINDKTSAFIQMQARGVYGAGGGGVGAGGIPAPLQGDRNAASPSDGVTDVGLHQAYFILNDFFGAPVDLKFGRQEIVLDGHRLFGNTGWTQGAQTHDAIRLDHHHGEHSISYMFIKGTEQTGAGPTTIGANAGAASLGGAAPAGLIFGLGGCGVDIDDDCDRNDHVIHANLKGILGGALSLYFVATDDNTFNAPLALTAGGLTPGSALAGSGLNMDNDMYTIGARQAGQLYGIDYRLEGYYQFGEAEGVAATSAAAGASVIGGAPLGTATAFSTALTTAAGTAANPLNARLTTASATGLTQLANYGAGGTSGVDRGAYMFGARIGKTFSNVMWKPSFTLWYDHLSGTDLDDVADNDFSTFDTLYDTGHKFYGFMDLYLNPNGGDTSYLGLQDLAAKMSIKPMANLTLKADIHAMWTETDISDDLNDLGIANATTAVTALGAVGGLAAGNTTVVGDLDSHLGEELDLTAVYKYNPNTTISVGYSHFWADDTFHFVNNRNNSVAVAPNTTNDDDASWAYVQFDVKF